MQVMHLCIFYRKYRNMHLNAFICIYAFFLTLIIIQLILDTTHYMNTNNNEIPWKSLEIWKRCLVKMQFVTECAGDDLKKFKVWDFEISDVSRSEKTSLVNNATVIKIIKQKPFSITADIAEIVNSSQQTISKHIQHHELMKPKKTIQTCIGNNSISLMKSWRKKALLGQ